MAKNAVIPQDYPRIQDENSRYYGCLDETALVAHKKKLEATDLRDIILSSIRDANQKSSRAILSIPDGATEEALNKLYVVEGKKLFRYFRKYCGDPASTAHQIYQKTYQEVGKEQFRNQTLQKERMNSGWRYQFLAFGCAKKSRRFVAVSDIGASEGDFNAVIDFLDKNRIPLSLYVSVKNRSNTMGGQDWPKAIAALERYAQIDKNRRGPYCCVFGIAMDRGMRYIKKELKTGRFYSANTEIWLSDFFWPFFSNLSYEEIMLAVLDVLTESVPAEHLPSQINIPAELLDVFGCECKKAGLVNDAGVFYDRHNLVRFFVG